jgi:hypothetical protein
MDVRFEDWSYAFLDGGLSLLRATFFERNAL